MSTLPSLKPREVAAILNAMGLLKCVRADRTSSCVTPTGAKS